MVSNLAKTRKFSNQHSRRAVLAEVILNGPLPRSQIAKRTGLTAASVSRITRDLIDVGLIEEGAGKAASKINGRGRPFISLSVRPNRYFVGGIAINAFRQDVVIADMTNAPLASRLVTFSDLSNPQVVLSECAKVLNALIEEVGINRKKLIGCGLIITGAIDPDNGILRSAPVLGWEEVPAVSLIEKIVGVPIFLESISNAKNLTCHGFGPTRGQDSVILFNASLAIGCSLLLDGRLIRSKESNAGLIESLPIPLESTGELKVLDEVAGGFAVIETDLSADDAAQDYAAGLIQRLHLARSNDTDAGKQVTQAGRSLAYAISVANAFLHPEMVIVSGPMIESELYCEGIRSRLGELLGQDFVRTRLRFSPISSQEAAQSLAIYKSVSTDGMLDWKALA